VAEFLHPWGTMIAGAILGIVLIMWLGKQISVKGLDLDDPLSEKFRQPPYKPQRTIPPPPPRNDDWV